MRNEEQTKKAIEEYNQSIERRNIILNKIKKGEFSLSELIKLIKK